MRVARRDRGPDADPAQSGARTVNLGGGRRVPYPEPGTPAATKIGKANRRVDTKPEVRVRSALHRQGLRYRKDLLIRVGAVRVRPDVVFTRARVALFIDGCFWHGCPDHQQVPRTNQGYWIPKLAANVERDRRVDAALREDGWAVLRAWEHEPVEAVVQRVISTLHAVSSSLSSITRSQDR
jgi:DNA mismatch endonuclease (patch repair protein)